MVGLWQQAPKCLARYAQVCVTVFVLEPRTFSAGEPPTAVGRTGEGNMLAHCSLGWLPVCEFVPRLAFSVFESWCLGSKGEQLFDKGFQHLID